MTDESMDDVALRKAKAEADLAQEELDEWRSLPARAAREAERQALASKSGREQLPDLSQIDRGSLTTPESGTLFGSLLGTHALVDVATSTAADVVARARLKSDGRRLHFLVTTDGQFAASDGAYVDARRNVDVLHLQLTTFLDGAPAPGPGDRTVPDVSLVPAASAVASLVPALLSLTSSRRTLSAESSSLDAAAAAASVAAALATNHAVWHDGVSVLGPLEQSPLLQRLTDLEARRAELAEVAAETDPARVAEATRLTVALDTLLAALGTVPPGSDRSLLVSALLRERVHVPQDGGGASSQPKVWVVWVQGASSSAQQLIDDRPLFFKDKVSTLVSVGLTYLLVEAETGQVQGGGTKIETRSVSGEIGSDFDFPALGRS